MSRAPLIVVAALCAGCFLDSSSQLDPAAGGGAAAPSGGGGAGGVGAGGSSECEMPEDCGPAGDCSGFACVEGQCEATVEPSGTPCGEAAECDGDGACLGVPGAECDDAADCATNQCADGVCCDSACDAECESCVVDGLAGTCSPLAAATDPDGECGQGTCDGARGCAGGEVTDSAQLGNGAGDNAAAWSVATHPDGVFITGSFEGTAAFGGAPVTAGGNQNVFVLELDALGAHVDSRGYGPNNNQVGFGIASAPDGVPIVVGHFETGLDFGLGAMTNGGGTDAFIVRLGDSVTSWQRAAGSGNNQAATEVAVDASGNVFVAGTFDGSMTLGGATLTSAGGTDVFLAKLSPTGQHLFSTRFGDSAEQDASGLAVGGGRVVLVGRNRGTVNFGGEDIPNAGDLDSYVATFDAATMGHVFSAGYGGDEDQIVTSVAVHTDGSFAITGGFQGELTFGGQELDGDGMDLFVASFAADASHRFSARYGDSASQFGWAIAIDSSGSLIVTGDLRGSADFGATAITSAGDTDVFVAKFAATGEPLWAYAFGDAAGQHGQAVAAAADRSLWVVGDFSGILEDLDNDGGRDAFWLHLSP